MANNIDLFIFAVRYDEGNTHITHVKTANSIEVLNDNLSLGYDEENSFGDIYTRENIIDMIDELQIVYSAEFNPVSLEWEIGAEVIVYELNGERFIKTLIDDTESDNLGELPSF